MSEGYGSQSSTEEAGQRSREVAQQGQQKASEYARQGREQAKSQIATRKEQASGQLQGVAQALRQTGEQLREQDQGPIGSYADQAAGQAERFADYLSGRDAEQLLNDVEDFARNRPAIFLGGAFVLGAVAARFLKSSAGQREEFDVGGRARQLGSSATGRELGGGADGGAGGGAGGETGRGYGEEEVTSYERPSYEVETPAYEVPSYETAEPRIEREPEREPGRRSDKDVGLSEEGSRVVRRRSSFEE